VTKTGIMLNRIKSRTSATSCEFKWQYHQTNECTNWEPIIGKGRCIYIRGLAGADGVVFRKGMGNMRLVRLRPVRLGPRVICV